MLDTSVAGAFMNRRDDEHERVAGWMEAVEEDLFTTPLIVAEIDHLVSQAGGPDAALAFYELTLRTAEVQHLDQWLHQAHAERAEKARRRSVEWWA